MKIARYKPLAPSRLLSPSEIGRYACPEINLSPLLFGWDDLVMFCAPRSLINLAMRDATRSIMTPRRS